MNVVQRGVWLPIVATLGVATGCGEIQLASSPESVFAAAQQAAANENGKGFAGLLTLESRNHLTAAFVTSGMVVTGKASTDDEHQARFEPVRRVLSKHGVTKQSLENMDVDTDSAAGPTDYSGIIHDQLGFIADMWNAIKQISQTHHPVHAFAQASIVDVEIDGDRATALLDVEGRRDLLEFRKEKGDWKIHLSEFK